MRTPKNLDTARHIDTEALQNKLAADKAAETPATAHLDADMEKLVAKLEAHGWKRWTKDAKDRMYVDAEKLGLKVQKYGSGAVKHAEWDGEKKEEKESAMTTTTAITAMQELYQSISYDARMDYCTKEMTQRICRHTLAKEAERRGIADPSMMNPATGSVDKLSGWMCDYMELTPEEWGGHYFSDAGLVEVRKNAAGEWEEVGN